MDTEIREWHEGFTVRLVRLRPEDGDVYRDVISDDAYRAHADSRWVVIARNEGGCNSTAVDLADLLETVRERLPELWDGVGRGAGSGK